MKDWNDWKLIEVKNGRVIYQHIHTGQRIDMPEYHADHGAEWVEELNRKTRVNGPGNGQDGRQA